MHNLTSDLGQLSTQHDDVQQKLRDAFELPNTAVDIVLVEKTSRGEDELYWDRRLEWNQLIVRKRWNPSWHEVEEYMVKEPHSRDLGRHRESYQLTE